MGKEEKHPTHTFFLATTLLIIYCVKLSPSLLVISGPWLDHMNQEHCQSKPSDSNSDSTALKANIIFTIIVNNDSV